MKTTVNISFDPVLMATVTAQLKDAELGRLFRALTARMAGEDAEQYLTNSGLRLAFALLSPAIDESQDRQATPSTPDQSDQSDYSDYSENSEPSEKEKNLKKSKKEDLPPTPPIEEKIKKNNNKYISPPKRVCARGQQRSQERSARATLTLNR